MATTGGGDDGGAEPPKKKTKRARPQVAGRCGSGESLKRTRCESREASASGVRRTMSSVAITGVVERGGRRPLRGLYNVLASSSLGHH